jgi:hypothetical protein
MNQYGKALLTAPENQDYSNNDNYNEGNDNDEEGRDPTSNPLQSHPTTFITFPHIRLHFGEIFVHLRPISVSNVFARFFNTTPPAGEDLLLHYAIKMNWEFTAVLSFTFVINGITLVQLYSHFGNLIPLSNSFISFN